MTEQENKRQRPGLNGYLAQETNQKYCPKCGGQVVNPNECTSCPWKARPEDLIAKGSCPECGNRLTYASGCKYCQACAWEACG